MVEWQMLNATIRNIKYLRKVALSGDMAQLPPTVISAESSECSNFEIVSFFERMIKTGHPHMQLDIQYRMAPGIAAHVSETFYEAPMITHKSCEGRENAQKFSDVMVKRFGCEPGTSFFVSVENTSVWHRKGYTSFVNPEYINEICSVLRVMTDAGIAEKDILVLSFYSEERRTLDACVHHGMSLHGVTIKSVDAAQGSESPFVVLSTTRPGHHGIGFVANLNRQCVALSRAQDGLLIVGNEGMGNSKSGSGYSSWARLISAHDPGQRVIRRNGTGREKVWRNMGTTEDAYEQVD